MPDRRVWSIIGAALFSPILLILLLNAWWLEHPNDDLHLNPPGDMQQRPIIAGYFINWGIYDRNYNVIDLARDAHKLSHILYCFANLDANGTIVLGDPWADTDKTFSSNMTVNHLPDTDSGHGLHGNLRQLYLLKQKHSQLKVSLSVGGWSWSTHFSAVATDPERRARFTSSAVMLVSHLGLDGLDVDWEFPHGDAETAGYVELLKETRHALDTYQSEAGISSRMLLSVAMPCGPENYKALQLEAMDASVDIFYLMAYDFAGAWDATTGHQAPLYRGIDQAVQYFIDRVQRQKVVLGLPLYGRAFSDTDGLHAPFHGVPKGSWEEGAFDYKDLPREHAIESYDEDQGASWSYDTENREWITYDTPQAIQEKCRYIRERGLGGAMFWELSADHHGDHPRSLLNTVYQCFDGSIEATHNELYYPSSPFDNILH